MILIGTNEGIYRWFEGCGWPIFHGLQGRAIVSLASPGAGVIAAVDREGQVFESLNNGQDWQVVPRPSASALPVLLDMWGEPETIVLATRPLGLYRRFIGAPLPRPDEESRGGLPASWIGRVQTLAGGAATLLAPRRRTAPARPLAVWSALGKPGVSTSAVIRALAVGGGTSAPPWFAAIGGAGLWRSLDAGTTWQQCPGLPAEVHAVRTAPNKAGSVVAATADGCRFSDDDGQTWEDRSSGLENARYVAAIEVKPDHPDILFAGAAAGEGKRCALYESTNGGKSWTQVKRGFPDDFEHDVISDIRFDPAAPDNVVVALRSGELWLSRADRACWCPLARQIHAVRVLCAAG